MSVALLPVAMTGIPPFGVIEAAPLTLQVRVIVLVFTLICMFADRMLIIRCGSLCKRYDNPIWFGACCVVLGTVVLPSAFEFVTEAFGLGDANVALLAIALMLSLGLVANLALAVSRQASEITRLAEELGALKEAIFARLWAGDEGEETR